MTRYEELMNKKDAAEKKGWKEKDPSLRKFYANAAEGFELKAKRLTYEQACMEIKSRETTPTHFSAGGGDDKPAA
ncbi:hypothetical protein [Treponema pectinovorum]|uniref:hypothetical protein n=1 Tax=Treponema pectinovorum TaxID=164 RepID=UPI0011C8D265|nr:hypothetical protein [Treponema pectinovorum]